VNWSSINENWLMMISRIMLFSCAMTSFTFFFGISRQLNTGATTVVVTGLSKAALTIADDRYGLAPWQGADRNQIIGAVGYGKERPGTTEDIDSSGADGYCNVQERRPQGA